MTTAERVVGDGKAVELAMVERADHVAEVDLPLGEGQLCPWVRM